MRYAVFAILLTLHWPAYTQLNGKYIFRNITQEDGLLHSFVYDIQQDADGYMWIATTGGLQRYDGHRFVNYEEVINYPISTPGTAKLLLDSTNQKVNVVIGNIMQSLDVTNNKLSLIKMVPVSNESDPDAFIHESKEGLIFYEAERGRSIYKNDSLQGTYLYSERERDTWFTHDPVSGETFLPYYTEFGVFHKGSDKAEYLSDEFPTHPLLLQLQEVKKYLRGLRIEYLNEVSAQHCVLDSYRNLWILTWNEYLLRYDLNTQKLHYYDLQKICARQAGVLFDRVFLVQQVFEDRQQNIWLAIDNAGLALYDREKDDFQFITSDSRIKNGLEFNFAITTIFQDRDDNVWIGTDEGISIFNPYRNQFQIIRHEDGNPKSIPKNDILDVLETAQGEILVSSWGGGVSVFDHDWNFQHQMFWEGGDQPNQVWSLLQHDEGLVWMGTQAGYLHLYDPVHHTTHTIRPPELGHHTISLLEKDSHGNVYLGLASGLVAFWDKEHNVFSTSSAFLDTIVKYHGGFESIYVDNQNQCWSSFAFGLMKVDTTKHAYTEVDYFRRDGERLPSLCGLYSHNDSILLVATNHAGIQLFNKKTREFTPFFELGLSEYATLSAIRKDDEGNIWFSSQFELYRISPQMEVTRMYLGHDLIQSAFAAPWFYRLSDGRWVTSTYAELVCFDPQDFDRRATDLDVQISGFKVFDADIYVDSFLRQNEPVVLEYNQNFFTIEFTNLHFLDTRRIDYHYKLSDVDRNWVRTESPVAEYTDIKPGKYTFEVKAEIGSDFSEIASLTIIIIPPWWATTWFRVLCIIILMCIIAFLVRKRIQMVRKEGELKHRIAETEMMALRSQMNPHFIFNCINGIDALIQSNDKYRATTYLTKFAKLIRNVLETSGHSKIPLSKDMETLRLYIDLELFRHENKFTAELHADDDILQGEFKVPPLIIQPYVENAIQHGLRSRPGRDGRLSVSVQKQEDSLHFCIEDNGVGRPKNNGEASNLRTGYGMQLSSDRVRLFNDEEVASVQIKDLVEDGQAAGTRVEVRLKIN